MNKERFSILTLENDILEYIEFRKNYNMYLKKSNNIFLCLYKNTNKTKSDFWYKKYISKMRYLETNYRRTKIYTNFHQQLERNNNTLCDYEPSAPYEEIINTEPVYATVVEVEPVLNSNQRNSNSKIYTE